MCCIGRCLGVTADIEIHTCDQSVTEKLKNSRTFNAAVGNGGKHVLHILNSPKMCIFNEMTNKLCLGCGFAATFVYVDAMKRFVI